MGTQSTEWCSLGQGCSWGPTAPAVIFNGAMLTLDDERILVAGGDQSQSVQTETW